MKKSDEYAGNQVRILLRELKDGAHAAKVKAVTNFESYLKSYTPDVRFHVF